MPARDIVVAGASAGGVEALMALVAALPHDLPATILIVQHIGAAGTSSLPAILSRSGPLPAQHPRDGERLRRGHIYVAPPDLHLLVHRGHMRVAHGPRENRSRPAIDPLFRTAARAYGPRVVGIILSGALDDGATGLGTIKRLGGVAIVQDPAEALVRSMPEHALAHVAVDHCLPIAGIAQKIIELSQAPSPAKGAERMLRPESADLEFEARIVEGDLSTIEDDDRPGVPSQFGCPECGGVLWERDGDEVVRFRCRVGHAYSATTLLASQSEAFEGALWSALRALEEKASLTRRLADRAIARNFEQLAARYLAQLDDAEKQASLIRDVLVMGHWGEPSEMESLAAEA